MTLTDEETKQIRERLEKATPGPWIRSGVRLKQIIEDTIWVGPDDFKIIALPIGRTAKQQAEALRDGDFIAHARTDLPLLLASYDALIARVKELEDGLRPWANAAAEIPAEVEDFKLVAHVPAGPHAHPFSRMGAHFTAGNLRTASALLSKPQAHDTSTGDKKP